MSTEVIAFRKVDNTFIRADRAKGDNLYFSVVDTYGLSDQEIVFSYIGRLSTTNHKLTEGDFVYTLWWIETDKKLFRLDPDYTITRILDWPDGLCEVIEKTVEEQEKLLTNNTQ